MAPSLHQTLLMVENLDSAVKFYRDIIGLPAEKEGEGNVEFDTGQCKLVLEEDFDQEVLDAFGLAEPGDNRGEGVIVAISVGSPADVNVICERAESAGVTVRMAPREVSWGRRMALLADPAGYTVEISSPL